MYVAIRRMKGQPGTFDEAMRRIANGFVPILNSMPGFVEYVGGASWGGCGFNHQFL